MGRIRNEIEIQGKKYWALFDSGARNTYVTKDLAKLLLVQQLPEPLSASLGGKTYLIEKTTTLMAYVEKKFISTNAYVISEIGKDEEERPIDVLFGALAMQQWGIRLIPEEEKLDMSHYPKNFEFILT